MKHLVGNIQRFELGGECIAISINGEKHGVQAWHVLVPPRGQVVRILTVFVSGEKREWNLKIVMLRQQLGNLLCHGGFIPRTHK